MRRILLILAVLAAALAWALFLQDDDAGGEGPGLTQVDTLELPTAGAAVADREEIEDLPEVGREPKIGSGRFHLPGKVVDEAGAPVPGAWVFAHSSPFPIIEFEGGIEELFSKPLDFTLEPLAATLADDEGRFSLEGLHGRTLYLEARADRRLTKGRIRVPPRRLLEDGEIVLRTVAGGALTGTVVNASGTPVAEAEVLVSPGIKYLLAAFRNREFFAEHVFTDAAGRFHLPAVPAGCVLTAYGMDGAIRPGMTEIPPVGRGGHSRVEIQLSVSGTLSGKVVDSDQKGVPGAMVLALPLDLRRAVPFLRDAGAWTARTGGGGQYRFPELPQGNYLLLSQGGGARSAPLGAPVAGESMAPDLELETKEIVEGRVVDVRGRPIANARVELVSIPTNKDGDTKKGPGDFNFIMEIAEELLPELIPEPTFVRTNASGRFKIPAWKTARLRVVAETHVPSDFKLTEALKEDKKPVLLLTRPGSIEGIAVDGAARKPVQFFMARAERKGKAEGEPWVDWKNPPAEDEHVLVSTQGWKGQLSGGSMRLFDAGDGKFKLEGLMPGEWVAVVQAEGYQPAESTVLTIKEGVARKGVIVHVSRGATVSGRVVRRGTDEGIPGATVVVGEGKETSFLGLLQGFGDLTAIGETDANGDFRVTGAVDGSDHVSVLSDGFASASLEIEPVQEMEERQGVRVEVSVGGTLTGRVTDRHGNILPGRMVGAMSPESQDFQQTATDAAGIYSMENMVSGTYFLVSASLDDDSLFKGDLLSTLGGTRFTTAFVPEGGVATVDIVDPSAGGCRVRGRLEKAGIPLPGAALTALGMESTGMLDIRFSTAKSDENGEFEFRSLAPGEYTVQVEAGVWRGPLSLVVVDLPEDFVVLSVPEGRISGIVVEEGTGNPVKGAVVRLQPTSSSATGIAAMFGGRGPGAKRETTGDDGRFEFDGVDQGTWEVNASGSSRWGGSGDSEGNFFGEASSVEVELARNQIKDMGEVLLPVGGNIRIEVVTASGEKLSRGFSVAAIHPESGDQEMESFGWAGNPALLRGLPAGAWEVRVASEGYASVVLDDVEALAGQTTQREVVLQKGVELKVAVLEADGSPAKGARVELLDLQGRTVKANEGQAAFFRQLFGGAPGGAVTLGFFAPGNYTVRATLDGEVRETGAWLSPGEGSTVEIRF